MIDLMNKKFSNFLTDLKKILGKEKFVWAMFMDCSKVFDSSSHDLDNSKLRTGYIFDNDTLNYWKNYLKKKNNNNLVNGTSFYKYQRPFL